MFCNIDLRLRQEAVFEKVYLVESFSGHSASVLERGRIYGWLGIALQRIARELSYGARLFRHDSGYWAYLLVDWFVFGGGNHDVFFQPLSHPLFTPRRYTSKVSHSFSPYFSLSLGWAYASS
jgi:hypothetical protein